MAETAHCLICHEYIGKGNDPAICEKQRCKDLFTYECAFNKFAKEIEENQEGLHPEFSKAVDDKKIHPTKNSG